MSKCEAVQHSDQMVCDACALAWDMNDPAPPECENARLRDALKEVADGEIYPQQVARAALYA